MIRAIKKVPFHRPKPSLTDGTIDIPLGHVRDSYEQRISLNETALLCHAIMFGGTRMGKSKFIELILRVLSASHTSGFCLIDPHGDLCEEIQAYITANWKDVPPLKRKHIYYFNPSERAFTLDPFQYFPPADTGRFSPEAYYRRWLEAAVDRVCELFIRHMQETDFAGMARLETYLKAIVYACGVRLDDTGRHLPLAFAAVLIDRNHPHYEDVYNQVYPHLPVEHRVTLDTIRSFKDSDFHTYVGSTRNRVLSFLRSAVKDLFTQQGEAFNFQEAMSKNAIVLVNLADTGVMSSNQANIIGGILIRMAIDYARSVPIEERQTFRLFIDEAHRFVHADLMDIVGQSSKWKLYFWFAVQGLSRLQKGDVDLLEELMTNCKLKICFQQQHIPHAETLAADLCYPDLDFTKLFHKQQFHDHYCIIETTSVTESEQHTLGRTWGDTEEWSETDSESMTNGTVHTITEGDNWTASKAIQVGSRKSRSEQDNWEEGGGRSEKIGHRVGKSEDHGGSTATQTGKQKGHSDQTQRSDQSGGSKLVKANDNGNRDERANTGTALARTEGNTVVESSGTTETQTHRTGTQESFDTAITESETSSTGGGTTRGSDTSESETDTAGAGGSRSVARGVIRNLTLAKSKTRGGSHSEGGMESDTLGKSTTINQVPLAQFRIEDVDTGQLVRSVSDQLAEKVKMIRTLGRGQAVISMDEFDASFVLQVDYVHDAFEGFSSTWRGKQLEWAKNLIYASHTCYPPTSNSLAIPEYELEVLRRWINNEPLAVSQIDDVDPSQSLVVSGSEPFTPEGCPYGF